jgi:hypothetical protein
MRKAIVGSFSAVILASIKTYSAYFFKSKQNFTQRNTVVLYGYETLSVTLREDHRLKVFENRVLRRIFGPKRDEVRGGWRQLHNEELNGLYSSPSIFRVIKVRMMRWAGHVARMGEFRGAYNILVESPERRRPLGRPRRR